MSPVCYPCVRTSVTHVFGLYTVPAVFLLALLLAMTLPGLVGAQTAEVKEKEKVQEKEKTKKAVVPFEMLASNHMMVRAKVNGKGPFRLIFDLGAPITLLSNRASETSGAIKKGAPKSFLFAMRGEGKVETLEVGSLTAHDLPVMVMDHPALRALGDFFGRPLDGIIGFTFFARYKTTIDYQSHEMTFEPVDYRVRDLLKDLPDRLAGPKVARRRVLAPAGVFGLNVSEPADALEAPGVTVISVLPGSPAETAGLKPGDILSSLDGRWTASVADTFAAAASISPGQSVIAVVVRDGKDVMLTVVPKDGI